MINTRLNYYVALFVLLFAFLIFNTTWIIAQSRFMAPAETTMTMTAAPATTIPVVTKDGPTPWEVAVNVFNPWVAEDDSNSYSSYKEWAGKTTRDEKIALIKEQVYNDNLLKV